MSTDMFPPESGFTAQMPAQQLDPLRLVRISANLLPDEITDGRRVRRTRTGVVSGLGAVVLLLAGWYGSTFVQAGGADEEKSRAEAQVVAAQQEQRQYSELTETKQKLSAVKEQLSTLMAEDSQWQKLLVDVRGAAPDKVELTQISSSIGAEAVVGGSRLPSQVTDQLMGTMTITGSSGDKDQVAAFVDNLRAVTGLANPLPTSITTTAGTESFTIQLDITQAALGGRFTPEQSETPAPGATTGGK
ncbi:PilN domain-containing protein [Catenuloplanes sp. NPDC051500]|uniref:PilN domain-containing protein n=1 Tax=Catenuloplanes sp. NPDC051500 TaxID=3363959 RepID=UPI00379DD966